MSYDLSFTGQIPAKSAVEEWARSASGWEWYDWGATYNCPHTGAELRLHVDEGTLSLTMSGNAAHVVGPELCRQVRAIVDRFGVEVSDPQMEGMGDGPLDEAKLLSGWTFYNGFATKSTHGLLGSPVGPHMAAAKLEQAVAWNRGKDALEQGDHWFVPGISYLATDAGPAETFVAWVGGQGSLPVVDALVTPMARVRWDALADALAGVELHDSPAPHYPVDAALAEKIDAVIAASPPPDGLPRSVSPSDIRTTEVVQPYLGSLFDSTDQEMLSSAAVLAHQTGDRKKAFGAARRLLELDPESHTAALVGAINGLYLAEYAEAARMAEAALRISPDDRTAQIVRCGVMTELGRYDEAVDAADRALAEERDAMVANMKGFALAGAGKDAEAKAAYEEALALIDAELAESPDEGDVVSRRAYALLGLGRAEEALTAAERALELVSDPFLTLQSIGRAHVMLGDFGAALEALERARREREVAPLASYWLAIAHARSDHRDDAKAALADAAISPHFRKQAELEPLLAALL